MVLDILSIVSMSAEPERLFSSSRKTVSDERHSLIAQSIEAPGHKTETLTPMNFLRRNSMYILLVGLG